MAIFDISRQKREPKEDRVKEEVQTISDSNITTDEMVDLGPVMRKISQTKGKIEITFQKNENPIYESLCLIFIKIPIYGPVVDLIKKLIVADGSGKNPLSKGKLSVDSKEPNLFAFVGAIRIKNINKTSILVTALVEKMKSMYDEAVETTKNSNIERNVVRGASFERSSTTHITRTAPPRQKTTPIGQYSFSDEEREEFRKYDELLEEDE